MNPYGGGGGGAPPGVYDPNATTMQQYAQQQAYLRQQRQQSAPPPVNYWQQPQQQPQQFPPAAAPPGFHVPVQNAHNLPGAYYTPQHGISAVQQARLYAQQQQQQQHVYQPPPPPPPEQVYDPSQPTPAYASTAMLGASPKVSFTLNGANRGVKNKQRNARTYASMVRGGAAATTSSTAAETGGGGGGGGGVGDKFSPSLKRFVKRAFENCKTESEKTVVQAKLRAMIGRAQRDGTVHTKDWDVAPTPLSGGGGDWLAVAKAKREAAAAARNERKQAELERLYQQREAELTQTHTPAGKKKSKKQRKREAAAARREAALATALTGKKKKRKGAAKASGGLSGGLDDNVLRKRARMQRFGGGGGGGVGGGSNGSGVYYSDDDNSTVQVVGTSQAMEKQYLRLTAAPRAAETRPPAVLRRALPYVLAKFEDPAQPGADYNYVSEQLKSIRQDMTVQRVRTPFTVHVYETHARLAINNDDLSEFNQCQTQLRELYEEGVATQHRDEFTAYRVLYETVAVAGAVGRGTSSGVTYGVMRYIRDDVSAADRARPTVRHALNVLLAVVGENHCRYMQLVASAPHLGAKLLATLTERQRVGYLRELCKAMKPALPVAYVARVLGFASPKRCQLWLRQRNIRCKKEVACAEALAALNSAE